MSRATTGQVDLLARLTQSHVFTDEERDEVAGEIADGLDFDRATKLIDRTLKVLHARKEAEKQEPQPDPCHFCDDAPSTCTVWIERDESIAGPTGHYTTAVRSEVTACEACADGREVAE